MANSVVRQHPLVLLFGAGAMLALGSAAAWFGYQATIAADALETKEIRIAALEREVWDLSQALVVVGTQLDRRVAVLEDQQSGSRVVRITADGVPSQNARQTNATAAEEHYDASIRLAFRTLDEQFQAVRERLEELANQDIALKQGQEATLVALQTELNDWRTRHYPPVWDLAAQLSGITVRFSEGLHFAIPSEAEAALQQVSTLLLAADTSLGVRVVGYADFDGTDAESNRITSQKRANEIKQLLVSLGVPEDRLVAVGRATEDRVVDSDAEGNANRRAIFEPFVLKDLAPSDG